MRKRSVIVRRKRKTRPDDFERFTESFWTKKRKYIHSRYDFDNAYDDYTEGNTTEFTEQHREDTWKFVIEKAGKKKIRLEEQKSMRNERPELKDAVARKRVLDIPARVKGHYVYAEQVVIRVRGKEYIRLRDAIGRFSKRKT